MAAQRKYPDELRERAVKMVLEIRERDGKGHGEIARVARQLDVHPEALRSWLAQAEVDGGSVVLLFDIDEHTGGFGGANAYFEGTEAPGRVDAVMIGYPGIEHVIIGGRGVLRARIHVHAVAAHSGSSIRAPSAIAKAAQLVGALHAVELPVTAGEEFPLPGKLTATAISGGQGYSTVPDLCVLNVDVRLTPAFTQEAATGILHKQVAALDRTWPDTPSTRIEVTTRRPEYAPPARPAPKPIR